MELYLFVVVVLFGLAISDLIVGVSNDAVNFISSSIGCQAASKRTIMIVAAIGMLLGVLFSSGMMEVARKGIFHPQYFVMSDLLIIFLAVMIADIILLDLYSTFGLPTSTTVSIVFELLGAAVAVSSLKIIRAGDSLSRLGDYINTDKALAIISGILLSVVVAFIAGAIIQSIIRTVFSFGYEKNIKKWGALWGGVALTTITYFILIKGAKGSTLLTDDVVAWIKANTMLIMGGSLAFWTIIFQLLTWFTRINILKIIVLVATGSLAMAFAANDLVNFIGVPIAGFHAFRIAASNPLNPLETPMDTMAGEVQTANWMLLIAGVIMVVTLVRSRKARSVTKTQVGLSRQDTEHNERFQATPLSRVVVRMACNVTQFFKSITPISIQNKVNERFDESQSPLNQIKFKDRPAFDLLRASVELVVASALISFATSLKLPLSTTYVTFMVAMGASLSDRAWGRESAVYRITGVFTVIGGWFLTAIIAFTMAGVFATLIFQFRIFAMILLVLFAVYMVYRTHLIHKNRDAEEYMKKDKTDELPPVLSCVHKCANYFERVRIVITLSIEGLIKEDRKQVKAGKEEAKTLKNDGKILLREFMTMTQDPESIDEISPRTIAAIRGVGRHVDEIAQVSANHVLNQHRGLDKDQKEELADILKELDKFIRESNEIFKDEDRGKISKAITRGQEISEAIHKKSRQQIKRIKKGKTKTRITLLFINILSFCNEVVNEYVEVLKGYNEMFD
ncbi:MAG: inorganic phosphate transporter [candidate division KSB1 bacterium]|nr:inorganic phosphate transporter [candidate division KSB1 bacterium]